MFLVLNFSVFTNMGHQASVPARLYGVAAAAQLETEFWCENDDATDDLLIRLENMTTKTCFKGVFVFRIKPYSVPHVLK